MQTNKQTVINFDRMSAPPPRNYLLSLDTLKTIYKGALGAMSFGAYHQFTSNKIMELNNQVQDQKMKQIEAENATFRAQLTDLNNKINSYHY